MRVATVVSAPKKPSILKRILSDIKQNWVLWLMVLPLLIWLALFAYKPLWGLLIAFQNYSPFKGVKGSEFVGFQNFVDLIVGPNSEFFFRALRNTLRISLYSLLFGFPVPILLAVLFHELRNNHFRKTVQTVVYAPHFISEVIVCSLVLTMLALNTGLFNTMLQSFADFFGMHFEKIHFMGTPSYFTTIYILSGIWKEGGFASIVFFAALCGIPQELYEAARMDGASRFRQIWSISLPGIRSTIIIMVIIRLGNILNLGFEKVLLLYNESIFEKADILGTYVYRLGVAGTSPNYGLSTAAGLMNAAVGFVMVIGANKLAKKYSETSLW